MARKRKPDRYGRVTVQVQLYVNKPDDLELLNLIDALKAKNAFRRAFREGLKLYDDRRANRIRIIDGDLIEDIRRMVTDAMEAMPQTYLPAPAQTGSILNGAHTITAPTFEDDDTMDVKKAEGADMESALNFLGTAFSFVEKKDE